MFLQANIRLDWKYVAEANTLAYFITQDPLEGKIYNTLKYWTRLKIPGTDKHSSLF